MDSEESLKGKFKLIQEQQQKKLLARTKRNVKRNSKKSAKDVSEQRSSLSMTTELKGAQSNAVWNLDDTCDDDLGLKLQTGAPDEGILEKEISELNDAVRVLKDENGRLYKLLSERDEEILQLRKKTNEERKLLVGGGVATDTAAARIMEVSRQNRDLKAELENEKNRVRLLSKKLKAAENLQQKLAVTEQTVLKVKSDEDKEIREAAALQDKLNQVSSKMTELRNQCETLKRELKVSHKVLAKEIGDGFNLNAILNEPSGFRGRQQQIITLQNKVVELKNKLRLTTQLGSASTKSILVRSSLATPYPMLSSPSDEKCRTAIKKMEKERKDEQEKIQSDLEVLKQDHSKLQQKHEASKVRNTVLSEELKGIKKQLKTLLEKGTHDNELIAALMREQKQLKEAAKQNPQVSIPSRQNNFEVEELKRNCLLQEERACHLETELKHLKKQQEQSTSIIKTLEDATTQTDLEGAGSSYHWTLTKSNEESLHPCEQDRPSSHILSNRNYVQNSSVWNSQLLPPTSPSSSPIYNRNQRKTATPPIPSTHSEELQVLRTQFQENKTLFLAAEVERNRLLQLVALLQKRIKESDCKALDTTNHLQQLRQKTVQLEKELGQAQAARHRSSRNSYKSRKSNPEFESANRMERFDYNVDQIDELQARLEIQIDENNALKEALNSALKAKEEDLEVYQEMMEHAKKVFLQGLRQFRQSSAPT